MILLMVSPTAKWTVKSVSNSNGVTAQMAMRKCIAIFHEEKYAACLMRIGIYIGGIF